MATRALVCVHRRHLTGALEIIDEAVSLADQSPGRRGHRFPIHVTRGFILTELDRLDEARSTLDTGRRISEELGTGWHLPSYQMSSAVTRFLAGDWDDAIAEVWFPGFRRVQRMRPCSPGGNHGAPGPR